MTIALEKRVKNLERKVAKQAQIIETLEGFLENRWAEDAIANHDRDDDWIPAWVIDAILDGENSIAVYRKFREMSQAELAQACDTSSAYISQLETGNRKPGADMLLRLAKALNLDAEDLAP